MDEAFSFILIGGYVGAGEVLDELFPPIYGWRGYCKYQLLDWGDFLIFLHVVPGSKVEEKQKTSRVGSQSSGRALK